MSSGNNRLLVNACIVLLVASVITVIALAFVTSRENPGTEVFLDLEQEDHVNVGEEMLLSFNIRNLEGQPVLYSYSIRFSGQELSRQELVKDKETRKVVQGISFSEPGEELVTVMVFSPQRNYELWLWVKVV